MSQRPPVPLRHANPCIQDLREIPTVKYQVLTCQGQDILVGRLKIPTPTQPSAIASPRGAPIPTGHAFILRRFDTDAISLTTMFRAAFPTASDAEEKREVSYVKGKYDLSGNNGSSKDTSITRLAGTWVSKQIAQALAIDYGIPELVDAIVRAVPEEGANYRKSSRPSQNPNVPSPGQGVTHPGVPALDVPATTSPAAKRRKESPAASPAKSISTATPRRPLRATQSPGPRPSVPSKTPKKDGTLRTVVEETQPQQQQQQQPITHQPSSPETVVFEEIAPQKMLKDDDEQMVSNVAADELYAQDVREQKAMIDQLKAQRTAAAADAEMEQPTKRARDEGGYQFEFKEPGAVVPREERPVATNRRITRRFSEMEPQNKSFAWGVAAFAVGMGAMRFLPDLISSYL